MTAAHISTPTTRRHLSHVGDFPTRGVEPHGMCRCTAPHPNRMAGMFAAWHQCGRCHRPIEGTP